MRLAAFNQQLAIRHGVTQFVASLMAGQDPPYKIRLTDRSRHFVASQSDNERPAIVDPEGGTQGVSRFFDAAGCRIEKS